MFLEFMSLHTSRVILEYAIITNMHQNNNFAFVDSNNLHLAVKELGWSLDYGRFRKYLEEKYQVNKAYMFIGYIEKHKDLYKSLQEKGYILIFKPTLVYKDGSTKGNCDAELVLQAMIDFKDYDKAILVTGDGDFFCLVDYLIKQKKLKSYWYLIRKNILLF